MEVAKYSKDKVLNTFTKKKKVVNTLIVSGLNA